MPSKKSCANLSIKKKFRPTSRQKQRQKHKLDAEDIYHDNSCTIFYEGWTGTLTDLNIYLDKTYNATTLSPTTGQHSARLSPNVTLNFWPKSGSFGLTGDSFERSFHNNVIAEWLSGQASPPKPDINPPTITEIEDETEEKDITSRWEIDNAAMRRINDIWSSSGSSTHSSQSNTNSSNDTSTSTYSTNITTHTTNTPAMNHAVTLVKFISSILTPAPGTPSPKKPIISSPPPRSTQVPNQNTPRRTKSLPDIPPASCQQKQLTAPVQHTPFEQQCIQLMDHVTKPKNLSLTARENWWVKAHFIPPLWAHLTKQIQTHGHLPNEIEMINTYVTNNMMSLSTKEQKWFTTNIPKWTAFIQNKYKEHTYEHQLTMNRHPPERAAQETANAAALATTISTNQARLTTLEE
jgi:hypothetical protein